MYSSYPAKAVFAVSLANFTLGCAVSRYAPSTEAMIVGRVMASLGNAGILAGFNMYECPPIIRRTSLIFYPL